MNEKWNVEAFTKAEDAAKKALVTNIEPLKDISIWFSGSAISNPPRTYLHANMEFTDEGSEKLTYQFTESDNESMEDAKTAMEWATGYLAAHLMKTIYRIEYMKLGAVSNKRKLKTYDKLPPQGGTDPIDGRN